MRKAYVLLFSDTTGGRNAIREWLRRENRVLHWRYDLPHSFYLISENSAAELAESLGKHLGRKGRFLIMEVSDNRQGWLPADTWYLLRNKKHKPKTT